MLRLRRYLKPYMFMLGVSVILLFVQANLDLALPDYLSRIVNTGIQQGGVADPVPEAMRQQTLERLGLFVSACPTRFGRIHALPLHLPPPVHTTYLHPQRQQPG